ncbi:MAG: hypothetical protein QW294_05295 [Candidatus Bathyarchaeia archaeon]
MKKKTRLMLMGLGIAVFVIGLILLQVSMPSKEEKKILKENLTLIMPGNSTLSIPIGVVEPGDKVEVRFAATQAITLMVVEKESGRAIEGMMETTRGTSYTGQYSKLAPITYDVDKPMDLILIISIPSDATYISTKLSYVSVYVHPPTIYPYIDVGTVLATAGAAIMIISLIRRK